LAKVLVTGGCGKLGKVINALLSANHEVSNFDVNNSSGINKLENGDVLNRPALRERLQGKDVVIHLAAIDKAVHAPDEKFMQVNVMGTWNVFEESRNANINKVIFMSSVAVYGIGLGRPPLQIPVNESHPTNPNSSYGLSKLLGENIARTFARTSDMKVICFRPPLIIYPSDVLTMHSLSREVDESQLVGKKILQDSGAHLISGARSYILAHDVANAASLAIEDTHIKWDVYNVSAPDTYSTQNTLNLITQEYGIVDYIEKNQKNLPHGRASMFDADRLKSKLSWKPTQDWKTAVSMALN
jgi:UDP-glucose 4-epimerase